jgi:large repetitive protein
VSAVRFHGVNAAFTSVSPTQVTATVPNTATTGPIAVVTEHGRATSGTDFVFYLKPSITSFTPTRGGFGTAVAISGARLTGATSVRFNGKEAWFTVTSANAIKTHVPAGASSGQISVTTPGGTALSGYTFTFIRPPRITGFSPHRGRVGTVVTITGRNLGTTRAVRFDGTKASFTVHPGKRVTARVPRGAGDGKISVTTLGGTARTGSAFHVTR